MIKGKCGKNAVYEFDNEIGNLVISGTGKIGIWAFDAEDGEEKEKAFAPEIKTVVIEDGITEIGKFAFADCESLASVTIGNSVTNIEISAFYYCANLTSIKIPDSVTNIWRRAFNLTGLKTTKKNYKAFDLINNRISCKDYEYTENKWSETLNNIEPCTRGYHYCNNLFNVFNYYGGEIDKDIAIYECEVGDTIIKHGDKYVTNRIKPVKRLYREDVIRILNGGE